MRNEKGYVEQADELMVKLGGGMRAMYRILEAVAVKRSNNFREDTALRQKWDALAKLASDTAMQAYAIEVKERPEPPRAPCKCQIKWIDEDGEPTPDTNDATMIAQYHKPIFAAHTGKIVEYSSEIQESFPICNEHLKKVENSMYFPLGGWSFVPLES